jgi:hypothetical protein
LIVLLLAAAGGWAVRPHLPAPDRPAAESPPTTEHLIARLEDLRAQRKELHRQEEEIRNRRWEIGQEEQKVLSEIRKVEEENERRLISLGHRPHPALASRR